MPTGFINAPPKTECEWASRHYVNETAVQAGGDRPHCYCCFVSTSNFMWLRPADTPGNAAAAAAAVLLPSCGRIASAKSAATEFKQEDRQWSRGTTCGSAVVAANNTTTSPRRLALQRWDHPKYTGAR